MKFRNKETNEMVEAKGYIQEFAYSHNSNWKEVEETEEVKEVEETAKSKEPTIADIKAKLDELNIEYNSKAKKEELIALLLKEGVSNEV